MNKRKWIVTLSAVLLVAATVTGYVAISAQYGSSEDPLVSKSYIEDVVKPAILKDIDGVIADKKIEFDSAAALKLQQAKQEIDEKFEQMTEELASSDSVDEIASKAAQQVLSELSSNSAEEWKVITLASGQTVTCEVGCQIILRLGAANCVSSGTVGLVNLTDGTVLQNGGALSANHLYIVTINGRGLRASGQTTILIKGSYTIN